jgi:hypothetical protein
MTKNFCQKIVKEYLIPEAFAGNGLFSSAKNDDRSNTSDIVDLCIAFSLNARQIHEFLRITAHVFSMTKENNSKLLWGWQFGTFFMSVISINNHDLYDRIGKREITPEEFTEFLRPLTLFNETAINRDRWAALLYVGVFGDQQDKLEPEFKKLGILDSSNNKEESPRDICGSAVRAFSDHHSIGRESVFSNIYEKLEGLSTFER